MGRGMIIFVSLALVYNVAAEPQDQGTAATIQSLQKEQQQLRADVNNLRTELQSLRRLLADLKARLPAAVENNAEAVDEPISLAAIDQKLNTILGQLQVISKNATAPKAEPRRPAMDLVGKPAPPIALTTMAGAPVGNAQFTSHPATVLNFVAPNCGFCARQIPKVEQVRATYEPKGVRFVNINEQMGAKAYTPEEAAAEYTSRGSNLELAMDPGNKIGGAYFATAYPTMFVIRSDGTVAHVNIGAKDNIDQMLQQQLAALLGESKPEPGSAPPAGK